MSETSENQVLNMPQDWWQRASIVDVLIKLFQTHVVGLLISGHSRNKHQYYFYTGFLVYYSDKLLWFTAGHVIDNISATIASSNFLISVMRWLDGCEVQGAEAIPVSIPQLKMKSWTSIGIDFGVIEISLLERENILANKDIAVMDGRIWNNLKLASPEGYYVVTNQGYPRIWNDFEEKRVEGNKILRSIKTNMACLPLQPVYPPSETTDDSFWKNKNSFYGKIINYPDIPNFTIEDISGMSGGPIISIERTPESQFLYRLAGIQVSWKSDSMIVRAEPIDLIASVLADWIN